MALTTDGKIAVSASDDKTLKIWDWRVGENVGRYDVSAFKSTTPEVQAHLFEPLFTTKPVGPGKGIGLAAVYAIVKNFGGSIFASSQPNQGMTYQVLFPRVGAADHLPAGE